jgi:hypothetical protein
VCFGRRCQSDRKTKRFAWFAMENLPDRVTAGPYRHWALSPVNSSASYGQNLTCDDLSAVFLADLSASSLADLSASSLAEAVFH